MTAISTVVAMIRTTKGVLRLQQEGCWSWCHLQDNRGSKHENQQLPPDACMIDNKLCLSLRKLCLSKTSACCALCLLCTAQAFTA